MRVKGKYQVAVDGDAAAVSAFNLRFLQFVLSEQERLESPLKFTGFIKDDDSEDVVAALHELD